MPSVLLLINQHISEYLAIFTQKKVKINWLHYHSVASTNTIAIEGLSTGQLGEGDIIWADEQWQGKGNGSNSWESEAGKNLTFSLVVSPHFLPPDEQFILTQMVSLVLLDTLKVLLPKQKCSIKWPNDIYVNNKKIAGVLIQNIIKGSLFDSSVIGVGFNVNQEIFHSDAPNPVSLIHFTNQVTDLFPLLEKIADKISDYYEMIKSNTLSASIKEKYNHALFQKNVWASYEDEHGIFEGCITGVDIFGRLQIQDRSKKIRLFAFKDVRFII